MKLSNRTVFATQEFTCWAHRDGLLPEERGLIKRYLDPERATLEAGTGGGRVVRGMQELGFTSLHGFDYVPELVDQARRNDRTGKIQFEVQDAAHLSYPDACFGQALYVAQFLSMIDNAAGRANAIREAYRILKPGGVALFSVLRFDGHKTTPLRHGLNRVYLAYIGLRRRIMRLPRPRQELPWPKIAGKMNIGYLLDRGPYFYWYRDAEIETNLRAAGFSLCWSGSGEDVREHSEPSANPPDAVYWVVCRKPVMS